MRVGDPVPVRGWRAALDLGFERRAGRTVLASRRHEGPLVVQKALHPEGEEVCHAIIVHPPAGIAGGDELALRARAASASHALLTTPGATKWYRSAGPWAASRVEIDVGEGAVVEWLPQETIVFDGALAGMDLEVRLARGARYIGWEILCLGRTGSGERFASGECRMRTRIERDGVPCWIERARIEAGGALMHSPAGLAGAPVCATFLAVSHAIDDASLAACRALAPERGRGAVTRLPELLVARYLGESGEAARRYFSGLWSVLRPAIAGREAESPRIWST